MANRCIAALFAHPDDEVLACGATLARHVQEGDEVCILILSTGASSRYTKNSDHNAKQQALSQLRSQTQASANVLGAHHLSCLDFPDNQMDTVPLLEVVQAIETFLKTHPAQVIYTHHMGDVNIDHQITHMAAITALRPIPPARNLELYACEVNSSTEWNTTSSCTFQPSYFVNAESTLSTKQQALRCYASECRDWPHPRSLEGIETLAKYRGMQSGLHLAEAFMPLRSIRI